MATQANTPYKLCKNVHNNKGGCRRWEIEDASALLMRHSRAGNNRTLRCRIKRDRI